MKIKIHKKSPEIPLPRYESGGAAGLDLRAFLPEAVCIKSGERALVPTGLFMELPPGFEGQVRPRSGLALRNGITVLNSPGTIDSDYRGEVQVLLINLGREDVTLQNRDRIAQLVVAPVSQVEFVEVEVLLDSERGAGGFGSTGK